MNIKSLNIASLEDGLIIKKGGSSSSGGVTPPTEEGNDLPFFIVVPNTDTSEEGYDANIASQAGAFAQFPIAQGLALAITSLKIGDHWRQYLGDVNIINNWEGSFTSVGSAILKGTSFDGIPSPINSYEDLVTLLTSSGYVENTVRASIKELPVAELMNFLVLEG